MHKPLLGIATVLTAMIFSPVLALAAEETGSSSSATTTSSTPAQPASTTSSSPTTETAATADESVSNGWEGVRTVVVTATREETEISKTGTSISVVSSPEIARQQYRTVEDTLREVPGVNVNSSGTPGQPASLLIRGAKTESSAVLLDGRRLPFNIAGSYNMEIMSLSNVDRVEVARGPMSSVQGGPAIGGVVNIVSRDGKGKTPTTEAFFEAGSFNTFREGVSSWGAEGAFDYSTGFTRLDTDFQRTNNEYRNSSNLTKLGYQINPDLYFDTQVIYTLSDAGSPNDIFTNDTVANVLRELWGVSPGLTWQTNDIWKQSVYYGHYQYRQTSTGFPPDVFVGTTGNNQRVQVNTDQINYQSTVQIFDNWKVTGGFDATMLDYYVKIDEAGNYVFPPVPGGTIPVQDSQTNTGYFLESQWEILEGWNFINNFRFDHYSDFGDSATWRVATSYEIPTVRTLVHANYGTGFAPPTPQDIATFYSGSPNLDPEKSKGYEFGVTQPVWGDKVSVFGTWFHNDVTNFINWDPTPTAGSPFGSLSNISHAKMEGVETGFTLKPIKEVSARLSYTNLSALREADNVQSFTSRLPRRPRHTLNASVTYQPIDPLSFTLSTGYVADRVDANFNVNNGALMEIENYVNVRFMASWKINTYLEVFGRVENLTDDQYQEVLGYPALDQAAYGGFKVTF